MIPLTNQDVAEFQQLYQRELGVSLSPAEAREYAESIIEFVSLLCPRGQPPPCPSSTAP